MDSGLVITSGRRERLGRGAAHRRRSESVGNRLRGARRGGCLRPATPSAAVTVEAVPVDDGVAMRSCAIRVVMLSTGRCQPSCCASSGSAGRRFARPIATLPEVLGRSVEDHRRPAHLRSRAPASVGGGGRRGAVVHGAVRSGLAPHQVDAAAVGFRPRAWHAANTGRVAGQRLRRGFGGRAGQDPARGAVRPRLHLFALDGRSANTTGARTRHRYLSCWLAELQRRGGKDNAIAALLPHADRALKGSARAGTPTATDSLSTAARPVTDWLIRPGRTPWTGSTSPTAPPPIPRSRGPRYRGCCGLSREGGTSPGHRR